MSLIISALAVLLLLFILLYLDARRANKKKKKLLCEANAKIDEFNTSWNQVYSTNEYLHGELANAKIQNQELFNQTEIWKKGAGNLTVELNMRNHELRSLHDKYDDAITKYDKLYREYEKIRPAKTPSLSDRLSQLLEQSEFHIDNITNQD